MDSAGGRAVGWAREAALELRLHPEGGDDGFSDGIQTWF